MSHLQKALNLWLVAGHSQKEFMEITGLGQSVCSRIFTGLRSPTLEQREAIYSGFKKEDILQGLLFLKADLEDQIPQVARNSLEVTVITNAKPKGAPKENKIETSKRALIAELESNEPHALELAVALYDWKSSQ